MMAHRLRAIVPAILSIVAILTFLTLVKSAAAQTFVLTVLSEV